MLLVVQGFGTLDSCAMNNLLLPFYFKKHTHTQRKGMLCGKLCWIEEEEEEWVEYIPSALRVCAYYTQRNGQRSAQWSGVNEGGQVVCVVCRSWRPSSPLYFIDVHPKE